MKNYYYLTVLFLLTTVLSCSQNENEEQLKLETETQDMERIQEEIEDAEADLNQKLEKL